jgi:hypothetical protein
MLIYLNAHYEHGLINTARLLIDIGAEVDYRAGDRKTNLTAEASVMRQRLHYRTKRRLETNK